MEAQCMVQKLMWNYERLIERLEGMPAGLSEREDDPRTTTQDI